MRNYRLKNYQEQLNRQVVHMDQAVCYCPEFRASKKMHDYPSRKLQMARAVYKGELEGNDYISDILFKSILSRQGERWQNFGECPEDCTDAMILSREMMVEKGFGKKIVGQIKNILKENNGHIIKETDQLDKKWSAYMPVSEESSTYLFVDDATYAFASDSARNLGEFLTEKGVTLYPEIKARFTGWEYFAYGLVEEGQKHLEEMIQEMASKGIDTLITLSGQAHYMWTILAEKLGLKHKIKVVNILDYCKQLRVKEPVYLYAGSFYTRYLRMEKDINDLVCNKKEEVIKNSIEFNPLLVADKRINKVTIWQKPLTAEYLLVGIDEDIKDAIMADAIADIKKGTQAKLIAFEAHSFKLLKSIFGDKQVSYFLDEMI